MDGIPVRRDHRLKGIQLTLQIARVRDVVGIVPYPIGPEGRRIWPSEASPGCRKSGELNISRAASRMPSPTYRGDSLNARKSLLRSRESGSVSNAGPKRARNRPRSCCSHVLSSKRLSLDGAATRISGRPSRKAAWKIVSTEWASSRAITSWAGLGATGPRESRTRPSGRGTALAGRGSPVSPGCEVAHAVGKARDTARTRRSKMEAVLMHGEHAPVPDDAQPSRSCASGLLAGAIPW